LISYFTNYSYADLPHFGALTINNKGLFWQIHLSLHLAAVATLNWRPVYDIEQRTKLLENEIALLKESNARIARFEQELFSSSNQTPSTGDSSPT
jgi:hypothetical protein